MQFLDHVYTFTPLILWLLHNSLDQFCSMVLKVNQVRYHLQLSFT